MEIAHVIKKLSPDTETKVGAILLSSDGNLIAGSFNGFCQGAPDEDLPCTRPLKYELIQHAERNMLYNCNAESIGTKGSTVICTLSPCLECLRACFRSKVKTIYFDKLYTAFGSVEFYSKLPDISVVISKEGEYTRLDMSRKDGRGV